MVVAYFIQSEFLKTSLAKLRAFELEKNKKAGFLRPIITAKHHIQPPSTRILIFLNPQLFWSGKKKIPRPQVSVLKPIHWTPLGILAAEHAPWSARNLDLALPFTVKNWARFFYVTGLKNSGSSVHKFPDSERIQKFHSRERIQKVADSYAGRIHRIRVDGNRIRKKKNVAD